MAEKQTHSNREEVPLERIVLSNMYSIEALIDVLAEKGLKKGLTNHTKPGPSRVFNRTTSSIGRR